MQPQAILDAKIPLSPPLASVAGGFSTLHGGLDLARMLRNNSDVLAASVAINLLSLALPIFLLQIYDRIIPNQAVNTLALFAIGFACVLVLDSLLYLGRAYIIGWNAARLQHALSCAAMGRLLSSDLQAAESQAPGVQLQRLRAIETLRGFHSGQAALLWIDLPFGVLFLLLIALIGQQLVILPIVVLIAASAIAVWTGRNLRAALEDRTENDNRRYNFIIDVLSKIPTVKIIGMESLMVRRYERLQGHSAAATYRSTLLSSLARGTGAMSSQVMMAAVAAYGSTMVIGGSLSVGGLAACTLLAGRAARPLLRLLGVWTQYQMVQIACRQLDEILSLPLESGPADADPGDGPAPIAADLRMQGRIELSNVTFRYSGKKEAIFDKLDLTVEPREIIGVTGSNGSGKSALLHLVSGLLRPQSGAIRIDGIDAGQYEPAALRSQICFLPQNGILFNGTILENMTMFQVDERLERAFDIAQQLGLNEVIARLPAGYDTPVGNGQEDGLPGGVKQRIAITRALAAVDDPKIILFDEANALLDPQSDLGLVALLRKISVKATMILVSHRPTILDLADRTFVLRNGNLTQGVLRPSGSPAVPRKGSAA